ncbi:chorismate mutase [Sulfuritortus calidifontis]|uniref:Bifunctional chorismate mutase/prephenate dehydratase n=1 Tax=Sulfuritortus calidifontis TaxID=1914471 RepID=A0A4V2UQJ3_9PROT|nr:prephenate dehydratase [Sulfuritortus calidifontis]TCS70879.1 chorismate mutase [Sulfuritortus calidifontis]
MEKQLEQLRAQIDALDEQILKLLNERAKLAQAVGHVKGGSLIYRPEREAQVLRRLSEANAGPLPNEAVRLLFQEVMSACRALERSLTVAFLGPEGTFSEAAVIKQFGHAVVRLPAESIDEVFRQVERGEAGYGVVPVENSTEGAVSRTLDLLMQTPLKVCGEVMLRVRQQLLRRADTEGGPEGLDGIERVYSHAQSLAQCHEWLNRHLPKAERIPVVSNAEAARLAAQDPKAAAVAGEVAAERYGLAIVARDIEDEPGNTTRFLVLGPEDAAPSGRDKTSLVLSAQNRPGALLDLIAPFSEAGIGLNRLESRPARSGAWEYVFFIDIDGHRSEPRVAAVLDRVRANATLFKVLGSYPVAV